MTDPAKLEHEPYDTLADRFERYLAETERRHPEVVDKIERLSGRRKREPLPLGRLPAVITAVVVLAIVGLVVYAAW